MSLTRFFPLLLLLFTPLLQAQEEPVFYGPDGALSEGQIPSSLKPWVPWVSQGLPDKDSPRNYNEADVRLPLWISRLQFEATSEGAAFSVSVESFAETSLPLPGGGRLWPVDVTVNGKPAPVLERGGRPALQISKGKSDVTGSFLWSELPQKIALPPQIGLLDLTVEGEKKGNPSWEADGTLWLQREASSEPVDEDFLSSKVHSLLEDGIPMWFETRIELIVAGKSREEELGSVLPSGWKLAQIESPVPVAIDDRGFLKAQLRAGRWSIVLRAFQNSETTKISFAENSTPATEDQALAFRAQPDFRQAEVIGLPQIDVAQTQVPEQWRSLPIYRWETTKAFEIAERVRGPGVRGKSPLSIHRSLWLDDDGKHLTYQDRLSGELRQIRRLDAAESHELGSVTVGGEPQLITHNPDGGDRGFEIRTPQLNAVATGRLAMNESLSATGWQTDAASLRASWQLSPGYRLFALFGADYTKGDWLTSWTLLDLFLLLLFTLAVFRLRGFRGAILALIAFGLAYHEPGAPKVPWLLLLIPVALLEASSSQRWSRWVNFVKWGGAAILLLSLAPFLIYQIQGVIFPQLERKAAFTELGSSPSYAPVSMASQARTSSVQRESDKSESLYAGKKFKLSRANLKADPKAVIQTGPGVPSWTWRTVEFGFDGPVSASQTIKPVLISPFQSRVIGVVRVLALILLAILLFCQRKKKKAKTDTEAATISSGNQAVATAVLIFCTTLPGLAENASAQFPEAELLQQLRNRLTEKPAGFPGAVSISEASLQIENKTATLTLEYHAAARAAAPVPVPLNAMEPLSAAFASGENATVLRENGKLWVLLPGEGIHTIKITGSLHDLSDWEWGFDLKPKQFSIEAPGWTVSGIRPDRSAENEILFSKAQEDDGTSTTANYDNPGTNHAILVERQIELGLVWRVQTTVSRLSPKGRAVAINIPLLPGEKVVSAGRSVKSGAIEVRLGPGDESIDWEGELSPDTQLTLQTPGSATWTEQWTLAASPVWNVAFEGLAPVFLSSENQLLPLWQPWPGENAVISVSRPKAVEGAAVTIDSAKHTLKPGRRQRSSTLELQVRTSLGEEFPIQLPADSEVRSLSQDGKSIPIRKEGDSVVVPLRPGPQAIKVEWVKKEQPGGWTRSDAVVLPVESANLTTLVRPSRDRWLILTNGPLRGPAVRFWAVFVFSILGAIILSRVPRSPLRLHSWLLLLLGLTQIHVACSLFIILWLFLALHKDESFWKRLNPSQHNILQIGLIGLTFLVIGFFIWIASAGLLGNPEMYVAGNGSSATYLQWFSARAEAELPTPGYWSISIWWFRLAMLLWALWLAYALVKWLRDAWKNSAQRGHFRITPKKKKVSKKTEKESSPPELPTKDINSGS